MLIHALLFFLLVMTVVRVRQQGVEWYDIISAPSQWLYFLIFGGKWGHSICSCVAKHVRDGSRFPFMWRTFQNILDFVFAWAERHHCDESLWRLEKEKRT